MYDVRDEDELQQWKDSKHPWTSPGSSPVFGNGCGAAGGAPFGCLCQDDTPLNNCFGDDTRPYGSCCGAPNAEVRHKLIMLQTCIITKETQIRSFLSVRENQLFIMTALRPPIRLPRHNF